MSAPQPERPNILFILADDHGAWAMRCAGNAEIETPNLDRLAATGNRFTNFFCASPVCSPARATLLTGRIPSQHGVHDWLAAGDTLAKYEPARGGERIEYLADQPGYTDLLAAAGYRCGLSGKWHMGDSHHPQKGFEYWAVHAKGGGPYYGAPMVRGDGVVEEPRYITDVFTDNALDWIDARGGDAAPFYLSVHYTAPHSPWERDQHPAKLYDRYFNDCPFASLPNGLAPPAWVRTLNIPIRSEAARRETLSGYFAAVTAMDRNIGCLLNRLEANGLRERTLVVFAGDNGMNMGHHGVYGKGNATFPLNLFEESVKVPFIASHPGRIPEGRVSEELVGQYDFLPTLLEYAGVPNPLASTLPGRSFAGLLCGAGRAEERPVVVYDEYGPVRMIRDRRWKLIRRFDGVADELYDLEADPGETRNLAGSAACRAVEAGLRARLAAWFERYADPRRDGARLPVTGMGQTGRCEEGARAFAPHPG